MSCSGSVSTCCCTPRSCARSPTSWRRAPAWTAATPGRPLEADLPPAGTDECNSRHLRVPGVLERLHASQPDHLEPQPTDAAGRSGDLPDAVQLELQHLVRVVPDGDAAYPHRLPVRATLGHVRSHPGRHQVAIPPAQLGQRLTSLASRTCTTAPLRRARVRLPESTALTMARTTRCVTSATWPAGAPKSTMSAPTTRARTVAAGMWKPAAWIATADSESVITKPRKASCRRRTWWVARHDRLAGNGASPGTRALVVITAGMPAVTAAVKGNSPCFCRTDHGCVHAAATSVFAVA